MSNIEWYISDNETNDYYAGSNMDKVELYVTVWNNRSGDTKAADIKSPVITCKYRSIEDSVLIENTNIQVLNRDDYTTNTTADAVVVKIKDPLLGIINDGDESIINNRSFIKMKLTINLKDKRVKENDLKELFLDIH